MLHVSNKFEYSSKGSKDAENNQDGFHEWFQY